MGEDAADDEPERGRRAGNRSPQPEGAGAFGPSGEVGRDERERGRRGERRPQPLDGPRPEQPARGRGEPADQRGHAEQRDAGDEDPAAADDVPRPPAEQEQPAEGDGVGVEHPGQALGGEAERVVDLGERDVHDGDVEDQHELAEQQGGEYEAGPVPGRAGGPRVGRGGRQSGLQGAAGRSWGPTDSERGRLLRSL